VFGYTSTQLCGDLVLILKPFLSDIESEFLKGLQAETGVEIVVDNVDEIVSFSGDFLSISRANEIISQFTKQLNETICENIEDKAPETCDIVNDDFNTRFGLQSFQKFTFYVRQKGL
jgi:hypothetical protein